jgi:hypothetical protein
VRPKTSSRPVTDVWSQTASRDGQLSTREAPGQRMSSSSVLPADGPNCSVTWALANAEERSTTYSSFWIPPRSEREGLRVGDFARLVFVDSIHSRPAVGERMWVQVVAAESGRYRGRLRNTPALIRDLTEGDSIEFGPEHVAEWFEREAGQ